MSVACTHNECGVLVKAPFTAVYSCRRIEGAICYSAYRYSLIERLIYSGFHHLRQSFATDPITAFFFFDAISFGVLHGDTG